MANPDQSKDRNNQQNFDSNTEFNRCLSSLPRVNSLPLCRGTIRACNEDFRVYETLSFEPCGEGEHLFLYIEKQGCNTDWVATQLQKHFQLRSQDVGYAGKKDRHSFSRQWFSLHLPGKQVSLDSIDNESFRVLEAIRHNKKLRKGVIKHNHFKIRITELSAAIEQNELTERAEKGVPNYFGYQRFGDNANNLVNADRLLSGRIKVRSRNKKGIYLSAARSFLFNLIVAARVERGNWTKPVNGDCLSLSGSQSYFNCQHPDNDIYTRVKQGDLYISSWMAGIQDSDTTETACQLEQSAIEKYKHWIDGLVRLKVASGRRPIRLLPQDFRICNYSEGEVIVEFKLPTGSFATSLLRELFIIDDAVLIRKQEKL